jgi:hypothetical protein
MGNDQTALRALFACKSVLPSRTGNRAGARIRSFDLANKAQQMGKICKVPGLKKQLQTALFFFNIILRVSQYKYETSFFILQGK